MDIESNIEETMRMLCCDRCCVDYLILFLFDLNFCLFTGCLLENESGDNRQHLEPCVCLLPTTMMMLLPWSPRTSDADSSHLRSMCSHPFRLHPPPPQKYMKQISSKLLEKIL